MSKSVYSLVLVDELVRRLDRAAYARGLSRSGMINEILADYLSVVTPEMQMQQALDTVQSLLGSGEELQLVAPPSGGGMVLRSALRYKYNPTVRYAIELSRASEGSSGRLRVQLRTRSEMLLHDAECFFALWDGLERSLRSGVESTIEPGRYTRLFLPQRQGMNAQAFGECIADYVLLFDSALRLYFENLDDEQSAAAEIGRRYAAWLQAGKPIL